jgi:polygalacturonase
MPDDAGINMSYQTSSKHSKSNVFGCFILLSQICMFYLYHVQLQNDHLPVNNAIASSKSSFYRDSSKQEQVIIESQSYQAASDDEKEWIAVNIADYGGIADNQTDNTAAFHSAIAILDKSGGGELIIPAGGVYQTAPITLGANTTLTVLGTIRGVADQDRFPAVDALPSYGRDADFRGKRRRQALVSARHVHNITIRGNGVIDGAGWYWYPFFKNYTAANNIGRPHVIEIQNCTDVEIKEVTLKDPAFWTLHPVNCTNVYIHHMRIDAPMCRNYNCPNTDGMDIDSCQNVLVE